MFHGSTPRWALDQLAPMWKGSVAGVTLAVLISLLSVVDPFLMRQLIDTELPHREISRILLLVLAIAACLFGRVICLALGTHLNFSIEQALGKKLRIAMLEQLNRLSSEYHEQTPPGETVTRLDRDVDQISELGSEILSTGVRTVIFLLANTVLMLRLSTPVALTVLPMLGAFLCLRSLFGSRLKRYADLVQAESGRVSSTLYEHISALAQIQLLCAERQVLEKMALAWAAMLRMRKGQRSVELLYVAANGSVIVLATLLVLLTGGLQFVRGSLTIGTLVAFYTAATRMFEPVSSAMELYSRLQKVVASIHRVRAVLESKPTVPDLGTIRHVRPGLAQGISFRGVSYSYRVSRPAVTDFSLTINPGEAVGIVGRSGSGKSTIARLLVRMSDPQVGEIRLDGHELKDYSLSSLRNAICYVPQQAILFNASVRDNLLYGRPDAQSNDLDWVIAAAQLMPVLDCLPFGLDTQLGPAGHSLSGGEGQRVALARALLRKAPVLVLDESTSALDALTEALVLESITRRRSPSILIVISHRLASLRWMDRLVVLQDGQVRAVGNHDTLQRQSIVYRSLHGSDGRSVAR